ncbi:MAG: hypothetical protein V4793_15545, partial [Paraburkholderia tropica]
SYADRTIAGAAAEKRFRGFIAESRARFVSQCVCPEDVHKTNQFGAKAWCGHDAAGSPPYKSFRTETGKTSGR